MTFEVVDQRFKVLLTEPADIDTARRLLAIEDVPSIPNGRVLRETGVNEGYSWSLDPNDIEFADVTIEVCDGLPSDVEDGRHQRRSVLPVVGGGRRCRPGGLSASLRRWRVAGSTSPSPSWRRTSASSSAS